MHLFIRLHEDPNSIVTTEEIFDEDPTKLRDTAYKIMRIIKRLEDIKKIKGKNTQQEDESNTEDDNDNDGIVP